MAEFKFSCQQCGQHIQLDELWIGHQIDCPACSRPIVVPSNPAAAAAPVAPAAVRIAHAAPVAAGAVPAAQPQTRFVPRGPQPKPVPSKKAALKKWGAIAAGVAVLGVGCYFGIPPIIQWQDQLNAKRRADAKNSDGGELGHMAELNKVLDATEPGGRGLAGLRAHGPAQRREGPQSIAVRDEENDRPMPSAAAAMPAMPPAHAVWTLDPGASPIPDGRISGMIAGTNFDVQSARIETAGTARVLRLTQGPLVSPERELLIYLHPKTGDTLTNQTWTVSKEMTGSAVPQIKKQWKTDPRFAAASKTFFNGYAMRLEIGEATNGAISGRIFVALPDTEQSVVAGAFNASLIAGSTATAMAPAPQSPDRSRRYGAGDPRQGKRMH